MPYKNYISTEKVQSKVPNAKAASGKKTKTSGKAYSGGKAAFKKSAALG